VSFLKSDLSATTGNPAASSHRHAVEVFISGLIYRFGMRNAKRVLEKSYFSLWFVVNSCDQLFGFSHRISLI
jgi:hypothetical protein